MSTETITKAVAKSAPRAVVTAKKPTIQALLTGEKFGETLKSLLPTYLTPKTYVQIVCTQLKKVPKLAKCEPVSFFGKLQECAERGLAPNGRHAYLLPFENRKTGEVECQLIIGYQGKVMLAKKYAGVKRIYCELWCKGDELTNDTGVIHHRIDYTKPRNENTCLGVVCICFFADDDVGQGVVVPKAEINAIRDKAKSYYTAKQYGGDCPWMSSWGEMAKKTAFNRLCKWMDLSPEFEAAAAVDDSDVIDADYTEVAADAMPKPREAATKPLLAKPKRDALPQPPEELEAAEAAFVEAEEAAEADVF